VGVHLEHPGFAVTSTGEISLRKLNLYLIDSLSIRDPWKFFPFTFSAAHVEGNPLESLPTGN
jgi:hypothetical protein